MRLVRPLPLISTAVSYCSAASRRVFAIVAVAVLAILLSAPSSSSASAQGEDFSVTIPPIELETTETGTLVVLLEPATTVGALSLTIDMTDAVFLAATESLVSGVCDEVDGQVRFSGFSTTGWSEPVELCRITVRGAQVPRVGTPTLTITVAANLETAPLTGAVDVGTISVGGASSPATIVTATPIPEPTPEPTLEPTPVPIEDPTPEPDAETEPEAEPTAIPEPSAEEPVAEAPATDEPATDEPATDEPAVDDGEDAATASGRGDLAEAADETNDPAAADAATDVAPEDTPAESSDAADPDGPADDAAADDPAATDPASTDPDATDTGSTADAQDLSESASPVTMPPIPAESSNRPLLIGLVAAALFAVGALLAFGARRANRS